MPEQYASKEPAKQIESQPKPIEPIRTDEAPVVPKPHSTDEIHNKTKEDKPKWTDKTVAFFTLCLVAVAIWQGIIFRRQWQEMHSGGVDTKALADAAKAQADAAKAQADEAKEQVGKMAEALTKTDSLIKEATAQAAATNALERTAQKTFEASNRPYVGPNGGSITWLYEDAVGKSVTKDTPNAKEAAFCVTVAIKNFGTVPGENYSSHWDLRLNGRSSRDESVVSKPSTIFPGQTVYMRGCVGTVDYKAITRGAILQSDIHTDYDGPSRTYHHCTREQFSFKDRDFMDLGDKCGDSWGIPTTSQIKPRPTVQKMGNLAPYLPACLLSQVCYYHSISFCLIELGCFGA